MADATLTAAYVLALVASGVVALGVAVWVSLKGDVPERRVFVGLLLVDVLWVASAALGLLTTNRTVTVALLYANGVLALSSAGAWYVFATIYTGRQLRRPRHAAVLLPLVLAVVLLVTNPLHHAHWSTLTYRADPLSFVETTSTVLVPLVNLWAFLAIALGIYYVGELFVTSRHRTSVSSLVLVAGSLAAALPNVLSNLGYVPVSEYDHTVFGVVAFAVASGYAIFGLGLFDIRPVARDTLFEQVDDVFLALDDSGRLVDYNAASEALAAPLANGDPVGQPLATACPPLEGVLSIPDTDEVASEIVTVDSQSGPTHYDSTVTPLTENGNVVGYSVVLRDVTTEVQYRRELEQRNEQLDQFASAVAHDLRNPLQVASGRARLLQSELPESVPTEDAAASVERLTDSLDRMDDIITDLRALAERGKSVEHVEDVDFETVARDAWTTAGTDEATLQIETGGTVVADRSRLRSILENLFRNSVEHAGTSVSCRTGVTDDGFYVVDDGPGVPEDERETVFEYGYTTEAEGSGLGLAIVETMVAAHGWEIAVTEGDDGGAKFTVSAATIQRASPKQ